MRVAHALHAEVPFEPRPAAAHSSGMRRFFRYFLTRWRERKTRRELHLLTDHCLKDIGLSRSQINALYR